MHVHTKACKTMELKLLKITQNKKHNSSDVKKTSSGSQKFTKYVTKNSERVR